MTDDPDSSSVDPPTYPVTDGPAGDDQAAPGVGWGTRLVIIAVVLVVVVIVLLHLTGVVGPTAH